MIELEERSDDLFSGVELQTPSNTETKVKDVLVDESVPSITSPNGTITYWIYSLIVSSSTVALHVRA